MGWQGGVEGGRDRVDGGRKGGVEGGRDRVDGGRKGGGGWGERGSRGKLGGGGHYSVLSFIKFEWAKTAMNIIEVVAWICEGPD